MVDTPDPAPPDPEVAAQKAQADDQRRKSIQSGLGDNTAQLLHQFGQINALSYAGLSPAFTSATGFVNNLDRSGNQDGSR